MWIGIDPGTSGAVAILDESGEIRTIGLKETQRDVFEWLAEHHLHAKFGVLERVSAMPKQGVSSTFKFGTSFGFCQGLLIACDVPFEMIPPAKWQKAIGCLSHGDKNVTKRKAQELFPRAGKITHATADAILLAEYARRLWNQRREQA